MGEEKVKVEIEIPKNLYEKVKEKYEDAGFKDLNEFILFLLEQVVGETEEQVFSPEEEEKVKERLRSLGYID